MIIFPSLPNDFSPCISYSKHYKSLRTINGAHIKKPPMVIRGQIKNGNGTNKYLRLSNLFEYHIYDLPLQRKPFFLYSLVVVFFLQYPQYGNLHQKNASLPISSKLVPQKGLERGVWRWNASKMGASLTWFLSQNWVETESKMAK